VAVIGDSANAASIELHARNGFAHNGLLPVIGWKHGRWVDSVLMRWPLGSGRAPPSDR
jgi:phosphinothricin acetyltransferase